jgi:hypothetical protein
LSCLLVNGIGPESESSKRGRPHPAQNTFDAHAQSTFECGNQRSFLSLRPSTKAGLDSAPKRPMMRQARVSRTNAAGK